MCVEEALASGIFATELISIRYMVIILIKAFKDGIACPYQRFPANVSDMNAWMNTAFSAQDHRSACLLTEDLLSVQ